MKTAVTAFIVVIVLTVTVLLTQSSMFALLIYDYSKATERQILSCITMG